MSKPTASAKPAIPPRSLAIKVILRGADADAFEAALEAMPVRPTHAGLMRATSMIGLKQILSASVATLPRVA
jgi:hypothetical protein